MVGDGKGVWDHVHIADLARLYEIVLLTMIDGGKGLPFGKQGIIFSAAGRHQVFRGQECQPGRGREGPHGWR